MIFVFVGPTLPVAEARRLLDATFLPPVSQGDVCRVGQQRPRAIGIIDGYFDQVPSVWHKEILWAMSQGIPVFGSASMGALRAAELAPFGMVGVGWVFEAFRSGAIEDDDEVAVRHGPPQSGYRQMSEAMVNMRQTLASAEAAGVIRGATHELLVRLAKELHYQDRDYRTLIPLARSRGGTRVELDALTEWLPEGRIDQKRNDAAEMLRLMERRLTASDGSPAVGFHFEHTTLWDELQRSAGQLAVHTGAAAEMLPQQALLDELRLSVSDWPQTVRSALARRLAAREVRRQGFGVSENRLYDTIVRFRTERGLSDGEDLERWLEANHLSRSGFLRLLEKEAVIREVEEMGAPDIASELVDYARISGSYAGLALRAMEKRPLFAEIDSDPPDPHVYERALEWFFQARAEARLPVEEEARKLGFESADDLRRAVLGEYLYRTRMTADDAA